MTKSMLARIWVVGLALIALGGMLMLVGVVLGSSRSGSAAGPFAFGWVALAIGGLMQFVAWVMALLATARVQRWGWFASLLVLGVFGLEFFVMLAYILWGPAERQQPGALPA